MPHALTRPANGLLAALPPSDYRRLRPHLESAPLAWKQVLYEPGQAIQHLHFLTAGVVSLLLPLPGGKTIEVGVVGSEGVVGLPVCLGTGRALTRGLIQVPGEALRMPATAFARRVPRGSRLHALLLAY